MDTMYGGAMASKSFAHEHSFAECYSVCEVIAE